MKRFPELQVNAYVLMIFVSLRFIKLMNKR